MNAVASWKSKKIRITQQVAILITKVQSVEGCTSAWSFTPTLTNCKFCLIESQLTPSCNFSNEMSKWLLKDLWLKLLKKPSAAEAKAEDQKPLANGRRRKLWPTSVQNELGVLKIWESKKIGGPKNFGILKIWGSQKNLGS